jgi:hypothetical protein
VQLQATIHTTCQYPHNIGCHASYSSYCSKWGTHSMPVAVQHVLCAKLIKGQATAALKACRVLLLFGQYCRDHAHHLCSTIAQVHNTTEDTSKRWPFRRHVCIADSKGHQHEAAGTQLH